MYCIRVGSRAPKNLGKFPWHSKRICRKNEQSQVLRCGRAVFVTSKGFCKNFFWILFVFENIDVSIPPEFWATALSSSVKENSEGAIVREVAGSPVSVFVKQMKCLLIHLFWLEEPRKGHDSFLESMNKPRSVTSPLPLCTPQLAPQDQCHTPRAWLSRGKGRGCRGVDIGWIAELSRRKACLCQSRNWWVHLSNFFFVEAEWRQVRNVSEGCRGGCDLWHASHQSITTVMWPHWQRQKEVRVEGGGGGSMCCVFALCVCVAFLTSGNVWKEVGGPVVTMSDHLSLGLLHI